MDLNNAKSKLAAEEKGALAWIKSHKAVAIGIAAAIVLVIVLIATGARP